MKASPRPDTLTEVAPRRLDSVVLTTRIGLARFRLIAVGSVASFYLLVITGGAVRLTGSGLGCPDWPTCYANRISAADSFHPRIEFANRIASVAVTIFAVVALLAALRLARPRRDLVWLSAGLVAGIAGQIVLGGLVVIFKLNPYLVALHFLLTLVILGDAIALYSRARADSPPGPVRVTREVRWLVRLVMTSVCLLVTVGTLVTGAGPHAGGAGAKRVPIAFRDIAELHSTIALFVVGLVVATLFALRIARVPADLQRRAAVLLGLLCVQAGLGFTQYALHDNAAVVEFHLAGAAAIFCASAALLLAVREPGLDDRLETDYGREGKQVEVLAQ